MPPRSGGACWTGCIRARRATADREACAAQERRGLLDRVYQGSAGKLVAAFLKEEKLTAQEREELRKLLDDMEV